MREILKLRCCLHVVATDCATKSKKVRQEFEGAVHSVFIIVTEIGSEIS